MKFNLLTVVFLLASACAYQDGKQDRGDEPVEPMLPFSTGLYHMNNQVGTLLITSATAKSFKFEIKTSSQNIDVCEADGEAMVSGNKAVHQQPGCQIQFESSASEGILVETECDGACGKTASMDGVFADYGDSCEIAHIQKSRAGFKKLYDAKQFVDAINYLSPLLTKCDGPMNKYRSQRAQMRNELAEASFKAGDPKRCQGYLKQIDASQDLNHEAYSSFWPKYALDELKVISTQVEATRKLCK